MLNRVIYLIICLCFADIADAQYEYKWERKFGGEEVDVSEIQHIESKTQVVVERFGRDEARSIIEAKNKLFVLAGNTSFEQKSIETQSIAWILGISQDGFPIWGQTYRRSENDAVESIIQLEDSSYVLTGKTMMKTKYFDYWLLHISKNGDSIPLLSKTYGGDFHDAANSMVVTPEGDYVLAGYSETNVDLGTDIWVIKLDKDGNLIWDKYFGGTQDENAYSICKTYNGGYAFAGYTCSKGGGHRSAWVVKVDNEGNEVWNKDFRKNEWDVATSIIETYDHGFAVVGYTKGEGIVNYDLTLTKFNEDGQVLWDTVFGGETWGEGTSLVETYDKGVAITGFTRSIDGDRSNFWILKFDSIGNTLWDTVFYRRSVDYSNDIIETYDKGLVIAGNTYGLGASSWDYAVLRFDNALFPDSIEIVIDDPYDFHSPSSDTLRTIRGCIKSRTDIKTLNIRRNGEVISTLDLETNPFPVTYQCYSPFEIALPLTKGRNEIQLTASNQYESRSSPVFTIYYVPYLLIDW